MYLLPAACMDTVVILAICLVIIDASIVKSETRINDPTKQELNKTVIDKKNMDALHISDDFFLNLFYDPVGSFWQFNCIIILAEYLVSCALISVAYEEPLVFPWTRVPHSRERALGSFPHHQS